MEGWCTLVKGHHTRAKGIGPVPILFVTAGHRAERAFSAFSEIAKGVTVPVQGPFGLLSADSTGRHLVACHWTWLSDLDLPASTQETDGSDKTLATAVASLMRTLQSKEPVADPSRPARIRMSSYVLIDLSENESIDRALRMMKRLRKTDPAHDMAVVALTGRTAASDGELDGVWFESWSQLTARLQDDLLAQKIYLLDGRTAAGTWFERPEQMDRFCGEFLLQHGITCRGPLRQSERRRIRPQENVLNVCGSFGLRTIRLDRPEVIARITQHLVHEDLADLYEEVLSSQRRRHIDKEAQALAERIENIHEEQSRNRATRGQTAIAASQTVAVRDKAVCRAVEDAITRVCGRAPLTSLCYLLECLEPRLLRLLTRQKLLDRRRVRRLAADVVQRRDKGTYEPIRVWLENTKAAWVDRFTPTARARPIVAVSRPAARTAWRVGFLFLTIGLLCLAAALFFQERGFAAAGILLSLAATVLATQPSGWSEHSRTIVPQGCRIDTSVPVVSYRKRAPLSIRGLAISLAALGVVAVTWSLWPNLWTGAMALRTAAAALLAVIGTSIILTGPLEVRTDQAKCQEVPDHLCPPFWTWRAFGLLCLAMGWLILSLKAPSPLQDDALLRWSYHAGGLLCMGIAAILGLTPRVGRVYLIERIPEVPEPLTGGITVTSTDTDLIQSVNAMAQWIERLTLDPRQALLRHGVSDATQGHEVLFDFVAIDWDRQLAQAFRETLRSRTGQSLRDLALEPKAWAQCVMRHLRNPQTCSSDLGVLFTLEVVTVWVNSLSVADLAARLSGYGEKTAHRLGRSTSPNWPAPRTVPDVSISVATVGNAIWDALAPLAQVDGAPLLVRRDWDTRADDVVVLQIVQGLPQGWRGYPALPTQICQSNPDPQDSGPTACSRASSRTS